jgi:hypothetical protein
MVLTSMRYWTRWRDLLRPRAPRKLSDFIHKSGAILKKDRPALFECMLASTVIDMMRLQIRRYISDWVIKVGL